MDDFFEKTIMTMAAKKASKKYPRQQEYPIPGLPGLFLAVYESGRKTYIVRYRDPITGKRTCRTLGVAA